MLKLILMKRIKLITFLVLALAGNVDIVAQTQTDSISQDINFIPEQKKTKKSFGQKLLKPVMWIARNWTASDPRYAVSSFYNWAGQIQNTTSFEWLRMETPENLNIEMNARVSNRLGPYFGWRWIFFGTTIDLSSIGKPKARKNEFTLSINSALFNIDLIRRRTGGDFRIKKLQVTDPEIGTQDIKEVADMFDLGDYIKNSITGVNINYFVNHKRYSNPAAFSNGAIQLRSVGSPIIGLGYTYQKVESDISDLFPSIAAYTVAGLPNPPFSEDDVDAVSRLWDIDQDAYMYKVKKMLDQAWPALSRSRLLRTFMTNHFPTVTTISDWHLQLGYAHNIVFSRRLLLGLSLIASPGLKTVRSDNKGSFTYDGADYFAYLEKKYNGKDVDPNIFRYEYKDTHFNMNIFARASLTWNFNRWRAGINAAFNNFFYSNKGMKVSNGYGNVAVYVGYCFGRKKEYRHDGAMRQDYINAALTKKQIAEIRDTLPASNINMGPSFLATEGKTKRYHSDQFHIEIFGCDLVADSTGRYGWYEIEDGFVAPGQDTEGRLYTGKVFELDKNGCFDVEAGHGNSIRAGNWWKSQLKIDQIPNKWYPELLHYALRGKLTLNIRGRVFGTKKPVRLVIDDFCINHGRETKSFFQLGVKSYKSNSGYSIEGHTEINGRPCRVYIEQKLSGKLTNMYVARLYESNCVWMASIDGNRPISLISIPGTHDSGAASVPEQPAAVFRGSHTQNFSPVAQLYDGIRAFDIRLKEDLHYGHTVKCRDRFDSTMVAWDDFLNKYPSEFIIALIGSDEGGKWDATLTRNFRDLINKYPNRFIENFNPSTPIDSVRGKILVIKRQEGCPFGRLLKFSDNTNFEYNGFCVSDQYNEHKTYRKVKVVEQHLREAYENEDPNKWYFTFNSIAWSPRRHNPYSYAWGGKAKNIRKPMNKALREIIELKDYSDFGVIFLDFYNDHGDNPQIIESILRSNIHRDDE